LEGAGQGVLRDQREGKIADLLDKERREHDSVQEEKTGIVTSACTTSHTPRLGPSRKGKPLVKGKSPSRTC